MTSYVEDSDGKFIPATQRPDGTWRKARRVKEGYVPQEEVPLYESKGKQFMQRKTGLPPGMCPVVAEAAKKEREKQERAKAKKLQKEAATASNQKPQKQNTPGVLVLDATATKATKGQKASKSNANPTAANAITTTTENHIPAVDDLSKNLMKTLQLQEDTQSLAKKLKKLRKKIREIESIEEKIQSGALKKPEKDQLDKVKRKKEIIKEIQALEAQLPPQQTIDKD